MHKYIIESNPPINISSSSFSAIFISNNLNIKISTIPFKNNETRYQRTEKQKDSGSSKSNLEFENKNGLNRYKHIYQNGIKQDIEIMKFLILGDKEFTSAMNPIV